MSHAVDDQAARAADALAAVALEGDGLLTLLAQDDSGRIAVDVNYLAYTEEFDETIRAEELCESDEMIRLRALLDQQLIPLQHATSKLANRLQPGWTEATQIVQLNGAISRSAQPTRYQEVVERFGSTTGAAIQLINNSATVIDLRSSDAFGRGHIVGAKNISPEDVDARIEKLDRTKPVVAVCDSGITSARVVDKLRKAGFESAWGLKGGMNAWTQDGLPVVTGKKTKAKGRKKDNKKA